MATGEVGTTAYYPKNEDEQDFVDKHDIEMIDDANGNGDEVFKGTSAPASNRSKDRHGYEAGKDSGDVYEETMAEMSDAQMKKREDIVKGMKKNLSSFKNRYGKDAESVMYATATKMAQEETEPKFDSILEAVEFHQDLQEEEEYIEAVTTIIEAIYESVDDEDKEIILEMAESEEGLDALIEVAHQVLED